MVLAWSCETGRLGPAGRRLKLSPSLVLSHFREGQLWFPAQRLDQRSDEASQARGAPERPHNQEQVMWWPQENVDLQTLKALCLLVGRSLKTGQLFHDCLNGPLHLLPEKGTLSSIHPSLAPILPNIESSTMGEMRGKVEKLNLRLERVLSSYGGQNDFPK